jgi:hypothetical protein
MLQDYLSQSVITKLSRSLKIDKCSATQNVHIKEVYYTIVNCSIKLLTLGFSRLTFHLLFLHNLLLLE